MFRSLKWFCAKMLVIIVVHLLEINTPSATVETNRYVYVVWQYSLCLYAFVCVREKFIVSFADRKFYLVIVGNCFRNYSDYYCREVKF